MKKVKIREVKELFLECSEKEKTLNLNKLPDKEIIKFIRIFQVINILERRTVDMDGTYGLIIKCVVKI